MANIFDIINNLTLEERFWLIFITLISVIPFIAFAIVIKRRIRVGKIDLHAFTMYFFFLLVILYVILDACGVDVANLYVNCMGIFTGIILMIVIFNKTSEGVRKTFIIELQLSETNANVNYCYTYNHAGYLCVIKLDSEGHESFWDMLKRIWGKRTYFICEGAKFEFTEHHINLLYFCTEWRRLKAPLYINGKQKTVDIIYVIPIPTTRFSQLEFLVNFQSFDEVINELNNEKIAKMRLEAKIYTIASELFKGWAIETEKAQWGDDKPTLQEILAELAKPRLERKQEPVQVSEVESEVEEEEEEIVKTWDNYE
ncbi:MAG: hypothetical protein ACTSRS_18920 [Candidatus Helarchaeota archaeon]